MRARSVLIATIILLGLCAFQSACAGSHGDLLVTGVKGASIYLDDELVGVTGDKGLLVEEVLAADYKLRAEVEGKVIFTAVVAVEVDDTVEISIDTK